jgi:N-acyl-phosphatidylethanolamine-hydrolysing phospholipase D
MAPIYKQIAQRYGPFDIAALPIGAYEPRWFYSTKHSSPSEALQIHRDLNCRRSVAVHWGTFALAMDGHVEPPRHLVSSAARMGMPPGEFEVLRHGESIVRGQKRLYPCSWQQELE